MSIRLERPFFYRNRCQYRRVILLIPGVPIKLLHSYSNLPPISQSSVLRHLHRSISIVNDIPNMSDLHCPISLAAERPSHSYSHAATPWV